MAVIRMINSDTKSYSVLWIDDHIDQYKPFTDELRNRHINVFEAADLSEAVRKFNQADSIDLILLDLRMKDESGFDFLRRVQNRTNLPICILSSYLHLDEYQKKISQIRKNVGIMDKNIPDPKDKSFDTFVSRIKYFADNPPRYKPGKASERLRNDLLSKDPFEITFSEYVTLPSKIKRTIREHARLRALKTINQEFQSGKKWILLCADPDNPVKSLDEDERIPTSREVTSIAMDLNRVPYQFSAPDSLDDILTDGIIAAGDCAGPSRISDYPTVTLKVSGEHLDVHFDTGSPWTFASYEELNELGVLSPSLIETDGMRGYAAYEYFSETIKVDLVNQTNGRAKRYELSVRAVKDWRRSPFSIDCPTTCQHHGKVCSKRRALIGRNLIIDNELEVTLCGRTRKSSFKKAKSIPKD